MGLKTPVAFLVFNRPDTTAHVFEAIRIARPSKLLVVADGPRHDRPEDAELCAVTRTIIEGVDWPCEVLTNYSDTNMGCKARVSSGLNWVFSQVEEAIILEDDCLPHPSFFRFCQEMLDRYRDDERVMMIGGTNYLLDQLDIAESYCFSRYFSIWGWASWRRAWDKYDINMIGWPGLKEEEALRSFYCQPFMRKHVTKAFDGAYEHRINTWDIQWFYSCLFNNGLMIIPKVNMISNIGTTGAHSSQCSINHFMPVKGIDTKRLLHPEQVHPNFTYDNALFANQFKPCLSTLLRNIQAFIRKKIIRLC